MRSGQLAHLCGVSTDSLRHYERLGLLPIAPRSEAKYRDYPAVSVQRVQLIQRALSIGFSLDDLRRILGIRDRGGIPCQHVSSLLREKIGEIELRLKSLTLMRRQLRRISKDWDKRLSRAPSGQAARLLENLPAELPSVLRRPLSRSRKIKGE